MTGQTTKDRIAKLSEGQRACLRLVHARWEIKEIARELGIAIPTVNQRLAAARRVLGVSRSAEAARLFAAYEQEGTGDMYSPPIYPPDILGRTATSGDPSAVTDILQDEHDDDSDPPPPSRPAGFRWPFATSGRPHNDLSVGERLLWMLVIAAGSMIAFGTMVSALDTLSRLL